MVKAYFKTFGESLRKVEPGYLHTLCRYWGISYEVSDTPVMPADAAKCVEEIFDTMVWRVTDCWPPRYPSYNTSSDNVLPKDAEEFDVQAKTCQACGDVRKVWAGPGRDVSTHYCTAHMFGALVLGLPIAYLEVSTPSVSAEQQEVKGDGEVSVEVPAPIVSAEQQEVKGDGGVSEMWRRIEDNLRAAAASGHHHYLEGGKVDQVLLQIRGGYKDQVMYPPSMFGFGYGLIPKTVDELKKDAAACKQCKSRTTSSYYCGVHKFAAAVLGAKVEP
jgi:hypothetical protein